MGRNVLVTGVSRDVAARHARARAVDPDVSRVIGVDVVHPRRSIDGVKFVRLDIRNPVVGKVLAVEDVDTVVHLGVHPPSTPGGRAAVKETNVIGTMQLLAACQRAPAVRRLVLRSSTAVYGASQRDPAMFTEQMSARRPPRSGYAKDVVEVESYLRGFARRRPDVAVTTLRMANMLSPSVSTPLSRYLMLPVVPTVLGFDPRVQVVHEDDVLESLRLAATGEATGTFNVAGPGILVLSQVLRRLGRPAVGVPSSVLGSAGPLLLRSLKADVPADLLGFLTYGRGVDTRAVTEVMGHRLRHTTAQTLDAFVEALPDAAVPRMRRQSARQRRSGPVLVETGEV